MSQNLSEALQGAADAVSPPGDESPRLLALELRRTAALMVSGGDTALALQLQQASELLIAGLERFRTALRTLALRHRDTLCVGRTHGIHAEPMVFGLKAALW